MSRSTLFIAAMLGLALTQSPGHAQPANSTTAYPPAPNSQQGAPPQPANSLPRGAATGSVVQPGSSLDNTRVGSSAAATPASGGVNTLQPLHPPRHARSHHRTRRHAAAPVSSSDAAPVRTHATA